MKFSRNLPFHTRRDAWVEVDLNALEHNAALVRSTVSPDVGLMAVLKADAYGHGTIMVLPTLEASGISMVGVAAMDEALQIREAGLQLPILVLGATPDWAMHYALEHDIQLTIFSQLHVESLERLYGTTRTPAKVHIKVDTGMHRIGVPWEVAPEFIRSCQDLPFLQVEGVFSHFAHTGDEAFTQLQIDRWQQVITQLTTVPPFCHIANSAGAWHFGPQPANMCRIGMSLFGYPGDDRPLPHPLRPVMGLKARIVHLADLPPGEGISYGQTFRNTSDQPLQVATLPLGYADGVPRRLSNRMELLYRGQRLRQVGVVTMDQLMVDVTDVPDIQVGDVLTLLGSSDRESITLTHWATQLDTIEYELMCALRVRLPKTYVRL